VGEKPNKFKYERALLQKQLEGLKKTVAADPDLRKNMEDHLVTLNSLKKRMERANRVPDPDDLVIGGTSTGRISSKTPNMAQVPRTDMEERMANMARKAKQKHRERPNRRAAIEHTRKLNESGA